MGCSDWVGAEFFKLWLPRWSWHLVDAVVTIVDFGLDIAMTKEYNEHANKPNGEYYTWLLNTNQTTYTAHNCTWAWNEADRTWALDNTNYNDLITNCSEQPMSKKYFNFAVAIYFLVPFCFTLLFHGWKSCKYWYADEKSDDDSIDSNDNDEYGPLLITNTILKRLLTLIGCEDLLGSFEDCDLPCNFACKVIFCLPLEYVSAFAYLNIYLPFSSLVYAISFVCAGDDVRRLLGPPKRIFSNRYLGLAEVSKTSLQIWLTWRFLTDHEVFAKDDDPLANWKWIWAIVCAIKEAFCYMCAIYKICYKKYCKEGEGENEE